MGSVTLCRYFGRVTNMDEPTFQGDTQRGEAAQNAACPPPHYCFTVHSRPHVIIRSRGITFEHSHELKTVPNIQWPIYRPNINGCPSRRNNLWTAPRTRVNDVVGRKRRHFTWPIYRPNIKCCASKKIVFGHHHELKWEKYNVAWPIYRPCITCYVLRQHTQVAY
jgi:hypothetical protein